MVCKLSFLVYLRFEIHSINICHPRFNNAVLGEESVLGICVVKVVRKCICLF